MAMKGLMRKVSGIAAGIAGALMLFAPAQAGVNLPVHKEVLDNGLTVLLHPNKQAPTVSCRLFYVTGSVHEVPGKSGLAHILEHELFKGTNKVGVTDSIADAAFMAREDSLQALIRPAKLAGDTATVKKLTAEHDSLLNEQRKLFVKDELWGAYQSAGGTGLNAFTTDLMTAYIVTLPKDKIELFMWLESDRMQNAVLREFYSERDVVREERRMRYDDKPPTIGWPSDIMNLTREMADEHYRRYYKPRNAILVLAGDLDTASTMQMVKKYFANIPAGEAFPPITVRDPEQVGEKRFKQIRPDAPNLYSLVFKTAEVGDPSLYALDIAEGVLNGRSGRLYKRLVEEEKLAVSVKAGNSPNKYVSEFSVMVSLRERTRIPEGEEPYLCGPRPQLYRYGKCRDDARLVRDVRRLPHLPQLGRRTGKSKRSRRSGGCEADFRPREVGCRVPAEEVGTMLAS